VREVIHLAFQPFERQSIFADGRFEIFVLDPRNVDRVAGSHGFSRCHDVRTYTG